MKNYIKYVMAAILVVAGMGLVSGHAQAAKSAKAKPAAAKTADADAGTVVDAGWNERCASKEKKDKKSCEIYARLEMKVSNMRVSEIAIGFPQDNSLPKGTARGAIILPLGIMLQPGATLAIDEGKPLAFSSKFCTEGGCYSYVNLNQDILDLMGKGKYLNIFFKTADNRDAHLAMSLTNFKKELDLIQ